MDDESGYEVLDDVLDELDTEEPVPQIEDDFHDTDVMEAVRPSTPNTYIGWPPAPPLPAEVEFAQGTVDNQPPVRKAGMFAAVRRPTTSSDTDD